MDEYENIFSECNTTWDDLDEEDTYFLPNEFGVTNVFTLVFSMVYITYTTVTLVWFFSRRSHFPIKRARKPILVLLSAIGGLSQVLTGPFRHFYGTFRYPCDLIIVGGFMFLPLAFAPPIVRLFLYRKRLEVLEKNKLLQAAHLHKDDSDELFEKWERLTRTSSRDTPIPAVKGRARASTSGFLLKKNKPKDRKLIHQKSHSMGTIPFLISVDIQEKQAEKHVSVKNNDNTQRKANKLRPLLAERSSKLELQNRITRRFTGTLFSVFLVCVIVSVFIILPLVAIVDEENFGSGCIGCTFGDGDTTSLLGLVLFIGFVCLAVVYKTKDINDSAGLRQEMLYIFCCLILGGIFWMTFNVTDPGGLRKKYDWSWSFLFSISFGAMHYFQCVQPTIRTYDFKESSCKTCFQRYCKNINKRKSEIDLEKQAAAIIESGQSGDMHQLINLDDVLQSDELRPLFKEHLFAELSSENLLFWEEVQFWKARFPENDTMDLTQMQVLQITARKIYNTFIGEAGTLQVNIGFAHRSKLDKIFKSGNPVQSTVFDEAVEEIKHVMADDSFLRFIHSDEFKVIYGEVHQY